MTMWTARDMASQTGRLAIVTGTSGIGLETAVALGSAGAEVILAGRDPNKGSDAIAQLRALVPGIIVRFETLDLANLISISTFGQRVCAAHDRLDLLVNSAEVMMPPAREETDNGFERQIGTNHLGHFALTAALLPLLRRGSGARVISLGSILARHGAIDFDDLDAVRTYDPMTAYCRSKLACLLFAFELQRRSWSSSWGIPSIAAHPGIPRECIARLSVGRQTLKWRILNYFPLLSQPLAQQSLPVLFAATSDNAYAGGYFGPDRFYELRGYPAVARVPPLSDDAKIATRLWEVSERLTGVSFKEAAVTRRPQQRSWSHETDATGDLPFLPIPVSGLR